jgi:hypothetical protein
MLSIRAELRQSQTNLRRGERARCANSPALAISAGAEVGGPLSLWNRANLLGRPFKRLPHRFLVLVKLLSVH